MKPNGIEVNVPLITKDISALVNSNKTGLFAAQEWKRLISPYTPRRDGPLEDTAIVRPFEIEYQVPYDFYVYYGKDFNFRKDSNPYATSEWDISAVNAGQGLKLTTALTKYLLK